MNSSKRRIYLLLGPVLFLLCCYAIPETAFSTFESRAAIGTVAWMAFWWVTAPVDYAVTAFLPIAVNVFVSMSDMSVVIANYASETILLLLGASILTISWEETGLDRRIAASFLKLIGDNFRTQLIFWFILSAVLSAVLPNAVVCATVTPIAVSMLKYIGEDDIANSRVGSKLLLAIVYAAGLGGLATPLGGAMNLVTVDYIQKVTGKEFMYIEWVIRFLPIMLVLLVINILFIIRDVSKSETLGGSKEFFKSESAKFNPMTWEEKLSLVLFLLATVLSFTREFYKEALPGLKPAYVFVICAILSFLVNKSNGERLMVWKSVQTKIIWEMLYIFAGGLAAGTLIKGSGAAERIGVLVSNIKGSEFSERIGDLISALGLSNEIVIILVIVTITLLLSDVTSNTATASVAMPIVISVMEGIELNPIPFIYIASVGVNLSYMLPTSIRAIPVGYGLKPKYMLKEGSIITVIIIIAMTLLCYGLLREWPAFSTAG